MNNYSASSTALMIAKSIVFSNNDPNFKKFIDPKMHEINLRFLRSALGKQANLFEFFSNYFLTKIFYNSLEKMTVPGIKLHYLLRKLKIEEIVTNLCQHPLKIKQIVIIGAGADSLGLRIAEKEPQINIIEIDHPNTQTIKKEMFNSYKVNRINNFILVPADLSKNSLLTTLSELDAFDFNAKTVFIAEGVFMYLAINEVKNTLNIMHKFPKGLAQFIFTYMTPNKKGKPAFSNQTQFVNLWLKYKKEPLIWSLFPNEIDLLLKELNFNPGEHFDSNKLRQCYLKSPSLEKYSLPEGENITWTTT